MAATRQTRLIPKYLRARDGASAESEDEGDVGSETGGQAAPPLKLLTIAPMVNVWGKQKDSAGVVGAKKGKRGKKRTR
eukprot:SAG11_NODE_160_length_14023_cov_23.003017_7_plen_78_part_00